MKKTLCIVLAAALALLCLAGCGETGGGETAQQDQEAAASSQPTPEPTVDPGLVPAGAEGVKKIALVGVARSTADEEYIKQIFEGALSEGTAFGYNVVTFITTSGKEDLAEQIIQNCADASFSGYIVSDDVAVYSADLLSGILASGIPVVAFDSLTNKPAEAEIEGTSVVDIANETLAQASLDDMVTTLGKTGAQVIRVLSGSETDEINAAYQAMEDSGSIATLAVIEDTEMVPVEAEPTEEEEPSESEEPASEQATGEDTGEAAESDEATGSETQEPQATPEPSPSASPEMEEVSVDSAKKILEMLPIYKTGTLDAIWCPSTIKSAEIVQVLKDAGRTEVKVFSTGISGQVISLMRSNEGLWASTAAAPPDTIGTVSMRMLAKAFAGEETPARFSVSGSVLKAADLQDSTAMATLSSLPGFEGAALTEEFLNMPWMDTLRAQYAPAPSEQPSEEASPSGEEGQPSENPEESDTTSDESSGEEE